MMNDVNFERNIERYEIQSQNNTNSNDQMAYSHQVKNTVLSTKVGFNYSIPFQFL